MAVVSTLNRPNLPPPHIILHSLLQNKAVLEKDEEVMNWIGFHNNTLKYLHIIIILICLYNVESTVRDVLNSTEMMRRCIFFFFF